MNATPVRVLGHTPDCFARSAQLAEAGDFTAVDGGSSSKYSDGAIAPGIGVARRDRERVARQALRAVRRGAAGVDDDRPTREAGEGVEQCRGERA